MMNTASDIHTTIQDLVADKNFGRALACLADFCCNNKTSITIPERMGVLLDWIYDPSQMFLQAARQSMAAPNPLRDCLTRLFGKNFDPIALGNSSFVQNSWQHIIPPNMLAVLATIDAATSRVKEEDLTKRISDAISFYDPEIEPRLGIEETYFHVEFARPTWEQVDSPFAEQPWPARHPALNFVGDLYHWLTEGRTAEVRSSVSTYVVLANPASTSGLVVEFTIELLPNGIGAIYPSPFGSPLLTADPDFHRSLIHAWCFENRRESLCNVDLRWSLKAIGDGKQEPIRNRVSGPSAGAAIACAIRALREGCPLDRHVAISAAFDLSSESTKNPSLTAVGRIDLKQIGVKNHNQSSQRDQKQLVMDLARRQIDTLLVPGDPASALYVELNDGKIKLSYAKSLDDAYGLISRYERAASFYRASVHRESIQLLNELCGSFVPNALAKHVPDPTAKLGYRREDLDSSQREALYRGAFPDNARRVRIFANSGFGKSTLLVDLQRKMSEPDSRWIAIRIGCGPMRKEDQKIGTMSPLSHFTWSDNAKSTMKGLANNDNIYRHIRHSKGIFTDEYSWEQFLWQAFERGSVVFLLDAIDQTTDEINKTLPRFLHQVSGAGGDENRFVMTGRLESEDARHPVFEGSVPWSTLYLKGSTLEQVQEYFGDQLSSQFAWLFEDWDDDEWSKWRPLLETPILMKMMRELAESRELEQVQNRGSIYEKTMQRLIIKGRLALKDAGKEEKFWNLKHGENVDYFKLFQDLAWNTIHGCDANETVELVRQSRTPQDVYRQIVRELRTAFGNVSPEVVLRAINLVTSEGLLEGTESTDFAWRHRSFLEFFLARALIVEPRDVRREFFQSYALFDELEPVFVFALSVAWNRSQTSTKAGEREDWAQVLAELAEDLIQYGGCHFVWSSLENEGIQLPNFDGVDWDWLCRWLVHRCWAGRESIPMDVIVASARQDPNKLIDVLDKVFHRDYRDSTLLHPAWELLKHLSSSHPRATEIAQRFQAEYSNLVSEAIRDLGPNTSLEAIRKTPVLQLLADDELLRFGLIPSAQLQGTPPEVRNFCPCPSKEDAVDGPYEFMMGANPSDQLALEDEKPPHPVRLDPFEIQRTPVTEAQYQLFSPNRRVSTKQANHPCVRVNYYMACLFAEWLSGPLVCHGTTLIRRFDLPSEAQWECACRAGTTSRYGVGDGDTITRDLAHYDAEDTCEVGCYPANRWGIHDMHGLVCEWCFDGFDREFYQKCFAQGVVQDPIAPPANYFIVRGGAGFNFDYHKYFRSSYRNHYRPEIQYNNLGFRLCRDCRLPLQLS